VATLQRPSIRSLPWESVGTAFDTPPSSVDDALYDSGLDYEVETFPMADWNPIQETWTPIDDRFSIRRMDSGEYLGTVSQRYKPIPNHEAFSFVDEIIKEPGNEIVAAWEPPTGNKAHIAVGMSEVEILGDSVHPFIICSTSHDGKGSVQASIATFQMACLNQLPSVSRRATISWSAVHSISANEKIAQANTTLNLSHDFTARTVVEMEKLGRVHVPNERAKAICSRAVSKSATQMSEKKVREVSDNIVELREYSDTLRDDLRGSAFGLLHAVTEYWGHYRPYRTEKARYQTNNTMGGFGQRCRQKTFELLTA